MKKVVSFPMIAVDQFWVQLTWTFWATGIFIIVNIVKLVFGNNIDSFYSAGYISSNIYMLVIGIIAISFLSYYVGMGVTRKNYFIGNVIASVALSIIIPIGIYVINLIQKLIVGNFSSIVLNANTLEKIKIDIDGNIIGEIIQSIILTPFVNPETNLTLSLALFSLHIFVFYIIGWLIGAAFQRLGVIGGILFIAIGIGIISIKDSMIRLALDLPLFQSFSALNAVPTNLALLLVVVVILITILLIHLLTRRAPIKI
ncbi:hypothetical protein J14TS2_07270 [Bacillus sp. J14TS2]|uniref:hypothetical protein n=1 Tax=Bacillus sp. J14TS2 TaxID=2807188 RepID=UPI001B154531|nr:hypothetical protein [Bacillus sp. J14TS2]GIN70252.1 hypothetical protein J14TS2_07270 [Bacillus sp. J14TS2]